MGSFAGAVTARELGEETPVMVRAPTKWIGIKLEGESRVELPGRLLPPQALGDFSPPQSDIH